MGIAPNVRFSIEYAHTVQLQEVRPAMLHIAARLAEGTVLERILHEAPPDIRDLGEKYFEMPHGVDSFKLRDQYLFPKWQVAYLNAQDPENYAWLPLEPLTSDEWKDLAGLLRDAAAGSATTLRGRDHRLAPFWAAIENSGWLRGGTTRQRTIEQDGMHRLQHASVMLQSHGEALVLDPHLWSTYSGGTAASGVCDFDAADIIRRMTGVLITHSHEDHWFLSSLCMLPRDLPIVVPHVPRATILCDDMASKLRELGFTNVHEPRWGDPPIRIGRFAVHALPFYGEQALRYDSPQDSSLRNWGNTYLIEYDDKRFWFIVDAGNDRLGDMKAAGAAVRSRFGTIDAILGNLRTFHIFGPRYINGGYNWLSLNGAQMHEFHNMRMDAITLGPEGVAELCAEVSPRFVLPYAHWWDAIGKSPSGEKRCLEKVQAHLDHMGCKTDVVPWNIGDRYEDAIKR